MFWFDLLLLSACTTGLSPLTFVWSLVVLSQLFVPHSFSHCLHLHKPLVLYWAVVEYRCSVTQLTVITAFGCMCRGSVARSSGQQAQSSLKASCWQRSRLAAVSWQTSLWRCVWEDCEYSIRCNLWPALDNVCLLLYEFWYNHRPVIESQPCSSIWYGVYERVFAY